MTRILICDDDREIVEAIARYLEMDGYQTAKAYSGREAVTLMEQEGATVHLIILDSPSSENADRQPV